MSESDNKPTTLYDVSSAAGTTISNIQTSYSIYPTSSIVEETKQGIIAHINHDLIRPTEKVATEVDKNRKDILVTCWSDDINWVLDADLKKTALTAYAIKRYIDLIVDAIADLLCQLGNLKQYIDSLINAVLEYIGDLISIIEPKLDDLQIQIDNMWDGDHIAHVNYSDPQPDTLSQEEFAKGININILHKSGVHRVIQSDYLNIDDLKQDHGDIPAAFPNIPDITGYLIIHNISKYNDSEADKIRVRQILYPDDAENQYPWTRVGFANANQDGLFLSNNNTLVDKYDDDVHIDWSPWTMMGAQAAKSREMVYMHQEDVPYIAAVTKDICTGCINMKVTDVANADPSECQIDDKQMTVYYDATIDDTNEPNTYRFVRNCNLYYNDLTVVIKKDEAVVLPDPTYMVPGVTVVFEIHPMEPPIKLGVLQFIPSNNQSPNIRDLRNSEYVNVTNVRVDDNLSIYYSLFDQIRYVIFQTTVETVDADRNCTCKWRQIAVE